MEKNVKIYVSGHRGMVGSSFVRLLTEKGYSNVITRTHQELDLCRQEDVESFFSAEKPEYVFLIAAKNFSMVQHREAPADYFYENMMLEMNVMRAAQKNSCKKLVFVGSACVYPCYAEQPMNEKQLFLGALEEASAAYGLAKLAGVKYCEFSNRQYGTDYIAVSPANLYGPGDNFDPAYSRALAAMIRRFHDAKVRGLPEVVCWGDGSPVRDYLYVDDFANLLLFLAENYSGNEMVNAGTGKGTSIKELSESIAKVVGYNGKIVWDTSKPNGAPCKLLDTSKTTQMGWKHETALSDGLEKTYHWFLENVEGRA